MTSLNHLSDTANNHTQDDHRRNELPTYFPSRFYRLAYHKANVFGKPEERKKEASWILLKVAEQQMKKETGIEDQLFYLEQLV